MPRNYSGKISEYTIKIPPILLVALITQIPLVITIYNSLFRWMVLRPDLGRKFVGMGYYLNLIGSRDFWIVFFNTVALTVGTLAIALVIGFLFALLIYKSFRGVGIVRTLLITPFFIMDSVIGIYWRNVMLDPSFGLIKHVSSMFGQLPPQLLARYPLVAIGMMIVWQWTPFFMLVLAAGLQSIPVEVMEAALVDGANSIERTIRIIIPMLRKYISISAMLGLIFIIKTFGLVDVTTHGGPGRASANFPYYIYEIAFLHWNIGNSAALSVILALISLTLIVLLFRVLSRSILENER